MLAISLETRMRRWLSENPLLAKVATLAGGAAAANLITMAASLVLAHIYTPENFGVSAVYLSIISQLCIVATLRYDLAITLPAEADKARALTKLSILIALAISTLVSIIFWLQGRWLCQSLGAPSLAAISWMIPIGVLGGAAYSATSAWALRHQCYREIARMRVARATNASLASILFPWLVPGPLGLLVGTVVGQSAGAVRLARTPPGLKENGRYWSGGTAMRSVSKEYGRFAVLGTAAGLLNTAGATLPVFLISSLYGENAVGLFGFAQRMMSLPMALVGTAVTQVFIAEASIIARNRPAELAAFFRNMTLKLAPFSVLVVGLGLTCPWVFPAFFGAKWEEAGKYAAWMSLSCAVQLIVSPLSTTAVIANRQGSQLFLDAMRAAGVFTVICIVKYVGYGPRMAVAAYSASMCIVYFMSYIVYNNSAKNIDRAATIAKIALNR